MYDIFLFLLLVGTTRHVRSPSGSSTLSAGIFIKSSHQNSPSSCTVTPSFSLSLLLTLFHSSELQKKKKHKRKMNLFKLVKTSFCKYPQQVTEQRNLCCFISSFSDHSVDNKASVRTQTVQALQQISLLILRPPNVAGNCPLRALLC